MSNWRDQILKEFSPKVARLTLVADPDGLLLEERILEGIRERGFELLPFEDHISFRYAYESKFRSRWDSGDHTDLVVVFHSQASNLIEVPFDLLQIGRRLSFNLGDIFPHLSYSVLAALDRGDLDDLYEAQEKYAPGQLGDNATKEFVLRHVFGIAPELIKQPSDLLRVLLRRHYLDQRIPPLLDERFIQLLSQNAYFGDWPLERLVMDRDVFYLFLQERWPIFLDHEAAKMAFNVHANKHPFNLTVKGPVGLPFDHQDIRVYIDNLFVEGLLHSVSHGLAAALSESWMSIGIRKEPIKERSRRISELIDLLEKSIPSDEAKYTEWFQYAWKWAELIRLANESMDPILNVSGSASNNIKEQIDNVFTSWIQKRFSGLINLPSSPPVMLHHLARFLAFQFEKDHKAKIALIVVDGLAIDQWLVIRNVMKLKQPDFRFREQAVFAWIPSLTTVSRQAIFAGKAPIYFPSSIHTTDRESSLWIQFWGDQGFAVNEVVYIKGLGAGTLENVSEAISHPKAKVVGLVVDKVDKIMHGMELGTAGMHNQVDQWAKQPYLGNLVNMLLERGFQVYLTSDHGNIEAEGCGRPTEGAIADLRGERVRIYPDETLRSMVKKQFPSALEWPSIGLPDGFLALLAPARKAFVHKNQVSVSHGGISIEEIIVPFVQIENKLQ